MVMTDLTPEVTEYLIELIQRGRRMPLTVNGRQIFLSYIEDEDKYYMYDELIGAVEIDLSELKRIMTNDYYSLGYNRALDSFNTEIKVGDTIVCADTGIVSKVTRVILEPLELLDLRMSYKGYVTYVKYDNVLKPLLEVEHLFKLENNKYTDTNTFRKLTKEEWKATSDFINADKVIVHSGRFLNNVEGEKNKPCTYVL